MPTNISTTEHTLNNMTTADDRAWGIASVYGRFVKRMFDVLTALIVSIITLPFTPFIALIIKWQSRGPILFRQARTGLNGRTFVCYKFRTMRINSESDTRQATSDDPRLFGFGKFMRRTHIDELPNLINVIKGDMSIIGPRPHMLYHTEKYSKLISNYADRHRCKPGITGYAQVLGYSGETPELWMMEERVKCDLYYIAHWSIRLDLWILYRTFVITIAKTDKHSTNRK